MDIRISAKALVVHDGALLLNRCVRPYQKPYYALPGGGQLLHEALEEAVRRECMEETGYDIAVKSLAAHVEMMFTDRQLGKRMHKHYFIFHCHLVHDMPLRPIEPDLYQVSTQWVDLRRVESLPLRPLPLSQNFAKIMKASSPLHLDFVRIGAMAAR